MSYVVYNKQTFRAVRKGDGSIYYKSIGAARRAAGKLGDEYCTAHVDCYNKLDKTVERVNLMTGKKYREDVNTPLCCSPASETYWSM